MSEVTNALDQGGGNALPAANEVQTPAPKSDAELAQREQQQALDTADGQTPEQKAAAEEAEAKKKGNRTRDYIERLQTRNAEMARRLEEIEKRLPKQEAEEEREPTAEDFGWDLEKFQKALVQYNLKRERSNWEKELQQKAEAEKFHKDFDSYTERLNKFLETTPDFHEAIGTMKYVIPEQAGLAIVRHENGPAIAYHLATNEDDQFILANVQPQYAAAAVERLAARLGQAQTTTGKADAAAVVESGQAAKPITRAPSPPPQVKGSSPSEIPPEKLTDEEWYKRDREKRRKR